MDEHEVESAVEMLMLQLGTRPYGNDPDAGLVSRQPFKQAKKSFLVVENYTRGCVDPVKRFPMSI